MVDRSNNAVRFPPVSEVVVLRTRRCWLTLYALPHPPSPCPATPYDPIQPYARLARLPRLETASSRDTASPLLVSSPLTRSSGAGGVYCQIIDSIFGDVPMARVKMGAKQEWEYLDNFKILQAVFKKHQIDKVRWLTLGKQTIARRSGHPTDRLAPPVLDRLPVDRDESLTFTSAPPAHPRRPPHPLQDARQPRVPPVAQAILGNELPWRRIRPGWKARRCG